MSPTRLVLFGDPSGIPQILSCLDGSAEVLAIVRAAIRPGQQAELQVLADRAKVPLLLQPSWRDASYGDFIAGLKALESDLFVINSYSMILRPDLLAIPARGTINVHGGLLPNYRGANVTEWALINEERQSGVTMHLVDAGIDTGPIIGQALVPLYFDDTWVDARQRINAETRVLLAEQMPRILAGDYSTVAQDKGRHWRRRSAEDGRFTWDQPLRHIYNLVRALVSPHPGASWASADGTMGTLDRWHSLAELAVLKARHRGGWRYKSVSLSPKPFPHAQQAIAAKTCIPFNVLDVSDSVVGVVSLTDIDCYAGRASIELSGCGTVSDHAVAAIRSFLGDELQISCLDQVAMLH